MTPEQRHLQRIRFLLRVIDKECRHLASTAERLFATPFTPERVGALEAAHGFVPILLDAAACMSAEVRRREWA